MKAKKIILDTNLWISFLISKNLNEIDGLLLNQKVELIFSKELLEEFLSVISRPKLKKYFKKDQILRLLKTIDQYGKVIDITTTIKKCRDPKDDFLLSLAVESKSDYLITGDNDLLVLNKISSTKIITWQEFIKECQP